MWKEKQREREKKKIAIIDSIKENDIKRIKESL